MFCFQLPTDEAIQFYEVYCEVIKLTHKLRKFHQLKNLMNNYEQLAEPSWFIISKEENKAIEIYMNDLIAKKEDSFKYDFKKSHTMFEPLFYKRTNITKHAGTAVEPLRHSADAQNIKSLKQQRPILKNVQSKEEFLNDSLYINNWLNVSVATNGNNDSSMIF